MAIKTKNKNKTAIKLHNLTAQLGILLMTAATTLGTLETSTHLKSPIILPTRAVFANENVNNEMEKENPIIREREESPPHFISYSVTQRTPGRSGKI